MTSITLNHKREILVSCIFSRCLGRSVTVFEAIILNSSIGILKGEFGNLYETNSSTVNLPKISDIKSLFYKLSGNQELNMTKIQLKSSLKQHKLIGDEINSLRFDFTLLKNLYNNTKRYVEHNFFDINQEILFNYNLEIDFEENVVNFFSRSTVWFTTQNIQYNFFRK